MVSKGPSRLITTPGCVEEFCHIANASKLLGKFLLRPDYSDACVRAPQVVMMGLVLKTWKVLEWLLEKCRPRMTISLQWASWVQKLCWSPRDVTTMWLISLSIMLCALVVIRHFELPETERSSTRHRNLLHHGILCEFYCSESLFSFVSVQFARWKFPDENKPAKNCGPEASQTWKGRHNIRFFVECFYSIANVWCVVKPRSCSYNPRQDCWNSLLFISPFPLVQCW